ncbi:MAG: uroporphyrinogen decarboxylase family protein [Candidatus Lokiarchaeia archaeon]
MTPRERIRLAEAGEQTDRVPIHVCAIGLHAAAYSGLKPADLYKNHFTGLMSYLSHLERFGYDTYSAFRFSLGGKELGFEIEVTDFGIPMATSGVKSVEDVNKLRLPDPAKDGTLPWNLWMIKLLKEKLGDVIPVYGFIAEPSTAAMGEAMKMEEYFFAVRKNPELIHAATEFELKWMTKFGKAQLEAGADALYMVTNSNLIGPRYFDEFITPYTRKIVQALKPADLHYIGAEDWSIGEPSLYEKIAQTGLTGFHLFTYEGTPIEFQKAICEKYDLVLRASFGSGELLEGTPEKIKQDVKEFIRKAATKRFVLATDALDFQTPNANIDAFMEAAKKFGKYPLDL